jgi:sulfite reductase alpha subunit-like flavoprotein
VVPKLMSLDDFLLQEGCRWTRIVIVVASSFGAGGAPTNARMFRRACEDWIAELKDGRRDDKFLKGLRFALLGYGDRHYRTYQRNPMVIEEALTLAGARRIGTRGESDADSDEEANEKAVSMWVEALWTHLTECLVDEPLPEEVLGQMQLYTEVSI